MHATKLSIIKQGISEPLAQVLTRSTEPMNLIRLCLIEAYNILPITLFGCLIWLVSTSIEVIIEDVKTYHSSYDVTGSRVTNWKKRYSLVLDFVKEVDGLFGPSLTVLFGHLFCNLVLRISNFIFSLESFNISRASIEITKLLSLMTAIICGTERMKRKVKCTT